MHTRSLLAAVAAVALVSAPAFATVVFDWNADRNGTASANTVLAGSTGTDGTGSWAKYQLDGSADQDGLFDLASYAHWPTSGTGAKVANVVFDKNFDRLHFNYGQQGTSPNLVASDQFKSLWMVDKSKFSSLSGEQIKLDGTTQFSYAEQLLQANTVNHWIIKDSGNYYMNTNPVTLNKADPWVEAAQTFDPSAAQWVQIAVSDIAAVTSATSGGSTMTFSDVQAIGMFTQGQGTGAANSTQPAHVYYGRLTFNAVAVPEPGTIALLGGSLAFGFLGRRKHA